MKAVRYDRFAGIEGIYLADLPEPVPGPAAVLVRVEAAALNPGGATRPARQLLHAGPDLAGEVVSVGANVHHFTVGDPVLGRLQSWDAHAQFVAVPAAQLVSKPQALSWDVAGSLYTTPMAGLGAIRAVEPRPGETIVISGASGGADEISTSAAWPGRTGAPRFSRTQSPLRLPRQWGRHRSGRGELRPRTRSGNGPAQHRPVSASGCAARCRAGRRGLCRGR